MARRLLPLVATGVLLGTPAAHAWQGPIRAPRVANSRRACIRCHLGHSHQHHHHEHDLTQGTARAISPPTLFGERGLLGGPLVRGALLAGAIALLPPQRSRLKLSVAVLLATVIFAIERGRTVTSKLRWRVLMLRRGLQRHQGANARVQADTHSSTKDAKAANRITWLGVLVNLLLSAIKLAAGIIGGSAAMVADAGHSLSDLLSDGVTLWAVQLARLPPDSDHPYGHGRFEAVGTLLIALLLVGAAASFGAHAYSQLVWMLTNPIAVHQAANHAGITIAMSAAVASILSKELLFRATAKVGERINSQVLIANAWHHRSDALSSVVALVGIAGASIGFPSLDPIAGLGVAAMVAATALGLSWDAIQQLTDTVDQSTVRRVAHLARSVDGVVAVHNHKVRARQMGSDILVDLSVEVPSYVSSSSASHVAETVRWRVLEAMPEVSEVLVHVLSEAKPCPMLARLRSTNAIEADVRAALRGLMASRSIGDQQLDRIKTVHKVTVHYINLQPCVEVVVDVDDSIPVATAREMARQARQAIEGVEDVAKAEVHLLLSGPDRTSRRADLIAKGPKREMV